MPLETKISLCFWKQKSVSARAVAEPRLGLEGPGLTLGSQYISLKLELARA